MGDFFGGSDSGTYDTSGMEQSAAQAQALQKQMYDQTREDVEPWYSAGAGGIGQLETLLGIGGDAEAEGYGSLTQGFGPEQFQEDPGAQFRQDESSKALERMMAAQGVTMGGAGFGEVNPQVAQALQDRSQGLASQEYGNAYNRYSNDQSNIFNRLMGVSGAGQNAANTMTGVGQNYATNVGNIGTGLASGQANMRMAKAAEPSMFDKLIGPAAQLGSAAMFASDERLKENIELVGEKNGHNIYEFAYKVNPDVKYRGVMAQEVQNINPDAVSEMGNGFLAVDYNKLGLEMERV